MNIKRLTEHIQALEEIKKDVTNQNLIDNINLISSQISIYAITNMTDEEREQSVNDIELEVAKILSREG